jgi:hypothetical protein
MSLSKDFKKYKWFVTSNGVLVVGGKSAVQNDELMKVVKESGKDYLIMHTSSAGSPFCVIVSDVDKVKKSDIGECAVFCGCFSRAWREGKRKTKVHLFKSSKVGKLKGMKVGTWGVLGKVKEINVELKLVLTKQKNVYRAVPEKSAKVVLMMICPGKIDKRKVVNKIKELLKDEKVKEDELLSALPAGGVRICKN